jgi:hypothetical protein
MNTVKDRRPHVSSFVPKWINKNTFLILSNMNEQVHFKMFFNCDD